MLRLVVNNERAPVGREASGERPDRQSPAREKTQAKNVDCSVELTAIVACSIVESLVRCSAIRPESGEHVLMQVAETFDGLVADAPGALAVDPEFQDFADRLEAGALLIRQRVIEMALSD